MSRVKSFQYVYYLEISLSGEPVEEGEVEAAIPTSCKHFACVIVINIKKHYDDGMVNLLKYHF